MRRANVRIGPTATASVALALACWSLAPGAAPADSLDAPPLLSEPASRPAAIRVPQADRATGTTRLAVLDGEAVFERYATSLAPASVDAFDRLLERVAPNEQLLSIRVIGHADSRGDDALNLRLSRERAATVADALRSRFPQTPVISLGVGETQPVADNATAAGRDRNRRVEIQMIVLALPDTSGS